MTVATVHHTVVELMEARPNRNTRPSQSLWTCHVGEPHGGPLDLWYEISRRDAKSQRDTNGQKDVWEER
jgi:hypothetical protein